MYGDSFVLCTKTICFQVHTSFNAKHAILNLNNVNLMTFGEYLRELEHVQRRTDKQIEFINTLHICWTVLKMP